MSAGVSAVPALPAPSFTALLDHVSVTPLLPVVVVLAAGWYVRRIRMLRRQSVTWPAARSALFAGGLGLALWTGCGGLETFATSVFWIWTTQVLLLLLVVPVLIVAGQPVELARLSGAGAVVRVTQSRPARLLGSPFVGPAVIPLLSVVLFFGPLPGWTIEAPWANWMIQLAVLALGCLIVAPLLDVRTSQVSLIVGLGLAIGFAELLIDAIPGIVLRLQTHLSSSFAAYRVHQPWTGSALQDQHTAGTLLWSVAELLDIPFIIVLFIRWSRIDDREAARTDAERDAQIRTSDRPLTDAPWWLADPQLRDRFDRDH